MIKKPLLISSLILLFSISVTSCSEDIVIASCVDSKIIEENFTIYCDYHIPEDIQQVSSNGKDFLVISQMQDQSAEENKESGIRFVNLADRKQTQATFTVGKSSQGQKNCSPSNKQLAPHGIYAYKLDDGSNKDYLAVINHAHEVDRIEIYTIDVDAFSLEWVGCLNSGHDVFLNDVIVTPKGSVFATQTSKKSDSTLSVIFSLIFGQPTGLVYHWKLDQVKMLPMDGTQGVLVNGITFGDNDSFLVAYMGSNSVKEFSLEGEHLRTYKDITAPDNLINDKRGRVWVASLEDLTKASICEQVEYSESCPLNYSVSYIDLETGDTHAVLENPKNLASFGSISTAFPVYGNNDQVTVWMGAWNGRRLATMDVTLAE